MDPVMLPVTIVAMLVMICMVAVMATLYKKSGPSEALIVSGGSAGKPIVIVGGGTVVLPIIQKSQRLSLELMSIELKDTATFPSLDGSIFDFDGLLEVSVGSTVQEINTAAQHFLEKEQKEIRSIIYDVAQDCIRKLIANSRNNDLMELPLVANTLKDRTADELHRYGLKVHSLRIRDLRKVKEKAPAKLGQSQATTPPSILESNGSLEGQLAVVTAPLAIDEIDEITIKLMPGSQRMVKQAKLHMPGEKLSVGTAVIIKTEDNDLALVEPWSEIHLHFPSNASPN